MPVYCCKKKNLYKHTEAKLPGDTQRLFTFNFLPLIAHENYKLTKDDEFSASLLKSILRLWKPEVACRYSTGKRIVCLDKKNLAISQI